jgi:nucleoside-diphosphate-sugar epimerase
MKALVTGAGGFLGQYVVEQLVARGQTVRSFTRGLYPELERLGVETVRGDIRDGDAVAKACQGCEVVYHTAAIAGIWGKWQDYYDTNTLGTQHVIQGCLAAGVRGLVYTSSPSVTFGGGDQRGVTESSSTYPTRWLCHYSHSKALAEQAVLAADGKQGLRCCSLRPHLIWGPRDTHLVPRLIERAKSGKLRQVGDGNNLVDMVYVENAAEAHLMAADALRHGSAGGQAYFISQGVPVNCWTWINQILELAGVAPIRRAISGKTAWVIGAILEAVYSVTGRLDEPRMTRFLAAQLSHSHYFDITRAREELGYTPRISTEEGMRRLGHWLQADGTRTAHA